MDKAIAHLLPGGGRRELTIEEQFEVDSVLDAAEQWAFDQIEWWEAAAIGGLTYTHRTTGEIKRSPQYTRFVAAGMTSHDDPRWRNLCNLCDTLIRQAGSVVTTQGVFDPHEVTGVIVR